MDYSLIGIFDDFSSSRTHNRVSESGVQCPPYKAGGMHFAENRILPHLTIDPMHMREYDIAVGNANFLK